MNLPLVHIVSQYASIISKAGLSGCQNTLINIYKASSLDSNAIGVGYNDICPTARDFHIAKNFTFSNACYLIENRSGGAVFQHCILTDRFTATGGNWASLSIVIKDNPSLADIKVIVVIDRNTTLVCFGDIDEIDALLRLCYNCCGWAIRCYANCAIHPNRQNLVQMCNDKDKA